VVCPSFLQGDRGVSTPWFPPFPHEIVSLSIRRLFFYSVNFFDGRRADAGGVRAVLPLVPLTHLDPLDVPIGIFLEKSSVFPPNQILITSLFGERFGVGYKVIMAVSRFSRFKRWFFFFLVRLNKFCTKFSQVFPLLLEIALSGLVPIDRCLIVVACRIS